MILTSPGLIREAIAIGLGAALGAWVRWMLAAWLNPRLEALPLGTLVANWIGAYLVGVAIAVFHLHSDLPSTWRLFIITGLLGALTTFSTFSAEIIQLLRDDMPGWALASMGLHLGGALLLTWLGILSVETISRY